MNFRFVNIIFQPKMSFTKTYQTERTLGNLNESKKTGLNQSPSLGPTQSHLFNQSKYSSEFTSEYQFMPHPIPYQHSNRKFEKTLSGIRSNFATILNNSSGLELNSRRRKESEYYKLYPGQKNLSSTQHHFNLPTSQLTKPKSKLQAFDHTILMNRSSSVSFQSASKYQTPNYTTFYNKRKVADPAATLSIIDQEEEQRKEKLFDYEIESNIVERDIRQKVVQETIKDSPVNDSKSIVSRKRAKSTFSIYGSSPN